MGRRWVLLLSLLLLTLFGCGGPTTVASPSVELDGEWTLTSGHGPKGEVSVPPRAQVTLEVARGTMRGTAACNYYDGKLVVEGSSIDASRFGVTEMACNQAKHRAEDRYLSALAAADSYRRTSDQLTLLGKDTELDFERIPTPATASFTGTDWRLEGLLHGSGMEAPMSSPLPARISFNENGTFEGTTGCRDISGRWQDDNGAVVTTEVELGAGSCRANEREQDEHLVSVLEGGFTVEIEENTMSIESDQGERGLYYVVGD